MKRRLIGSVALAGLIALGGSLAGCGKDNARDGDPNAARRGDALPDANPNPQRTVKPSSTPKDPLVGTDSRGLPSGPSGGTTGGGAGSGTSGTATEDTTPPRK